MKRGMALIRVQWGALKKQRLGVQSRSCVKGSRDIKGGATHHNIRGKVG